MYALPRACSAMSLHPTAYRTYRWESNFPPDRASCSYTVLWNAFKRISKGRGCSDEEMAALFGGTAKRVYKLDESKL